MSFIKEMEDVIEEVADWGANAVEHVITALSPDGRPFLYAEMTEQERITEYMEIRGDAQGWAKWIGDLAGTIIMKLQENALPPDEIKAVHPVDIAIKYAIEYSYDMEKLMGNKVEKVRSDLGPGIEIPTTKPAASPGGAALATGVL